MSLTLTINGVGRVWRPGSLRVADRIRERSILDVTIDDGSAALSFDRMMPVILTRDATVEFSGFLHRIETSREGPTGGLTHVLVAADMAVLAEQRIVAANWAAENPRGIIDGMIDSVLGVEGITAWTAQWMRLSGAGRVTSDLTSAPAGDLDLRVEITADDYTPAATQTLLAQWDDTGQKRNHRLRLRASGKPRLSVAEAKNVFVSDASGDALTSDNTTTVTDVVCVAHCRPTSLSVVSEVASFYTATGNHRSVVCRITATGALAVRVSSAGVSMVAFASTAVLTSLAWYTLGDPIWVKFVYDADNGAGGSTARFYTSQDGVTWTQLGADVVGAATSPFAATSQWDIGRGEQGGGATTFAGAIRTVTVFSDLAETTTVFAFDASASPWVDGDNSSSPGSRTQGGVTWTILGNGEIDARQIWHHFDADTALTATDAVTRIGVRVTVDIDNGAGGHTVTFYTSSDWTTWTPLGSAVTRAGALTSAAVTQPFEVGGDDESGDSFTGRVWRAEWRDAGVLVAAPDFSAYPEWTFTDPTRSDGQGNVWTLEGDAGLVRDWTVDTWPDLAMISFDYLSCAAALDKLAERVSAWWNVDSDRVLSFRHRTAVTAPVALDPATNIEARSIKVTHTEKHYRNTQYLRGGKAFTAEQIETFVGDGERRTFTVGYEIATEPLVEFDIGSGFNPVSVGIRGLETGFTAYWSKGEKEITSDDAVPTLIDGGILRVTYVGLYNMIVRGDDSAEQSRLAAYTGGSGRVDAVIDDASVEGRDQGFEVVGGYLAQFGADIPRLRCATRDHGFEPGQLVTVNLPDHGIDGAGLLIEAVEIDHPGGDTLRYEITAAAGPGGQSWAEFFRWLLMTRRRVQVSADELVILELFDSVSEAWGWSEGIVATVFPCPILGTSTFPLTLC